MKHTHKRGCIEPMPRRVHYHELGAYMGLFFIALGVILIIASLV